MLTLLPYEHQIMQKLLAGEHPGLEILRKQFEKVIITARELTGCGFYTDFQVPECQSLHPSIKQFDISDVHGDIATIEHGCSFILFIKDGKLSLLECYTYGEDPFPANPNFTRLYYAHIPNPPLVVEAMSRDMDYINAIMNPSE